MAVDMTDAASIAAFAEAVQARFGAADILVNGAGWGRTLALLGRHAGVVGQGDRAELRRPDAADQGLVAGDDRAHRQRRIVNIASDAGRVGSLGETVYSGAKGGLIAFTKALAREVARYQINVNCVCPGPTDTPLMAAVPEKVKEALKKAIPFRRFGKPEEVADAMVFFAGERAAYITGQVLSVSGGLTMAG